MDRTDTPPLSRRQILLGLGAVGVSAAGAGLGSAGYLADSERAPNLTVAGGLDIAVGYRSTYNGDLLGAAPGGTDPRADCEAAGLVDGDGVPVVDLADVKPGDCGTITAALHVCENPSRLWLAVDLVDAAENTYRPEEIIAGDETADAGELQELVEVTVWIDADADGVVDEAERVVYEGTLAGLATVTASGVLLTADDDGPTCAEGIVTVSVAWCLPLDGPDHNRAITDTVAFDCRFAAVQCRHDPTGWNPFGEGDDPPSSTGTTGNETTAPSADSVG
ncbi:hypothetical protein [Haloplanus aerogenes]|uniref:Uncharacterized protein n=1 Tax=Haloplanus aerogenes TaxID=660522 RepID=A0A3M0DSL8_9EURY|nr:hypothetical protein [Haloplanus aerogenes]AZH25393.1 hypothetical protein DU502_08375 [Haloplanus aerogenes]RMB25099.1 hypothetical protein ATH50_0182 [Haloplanus aerogenes]